ncbi:MAG TPA: hypothetical protein VHQ47_21070 [Phycisphaerae bacterium]|nr:hypothetical protein [Phycisphaerae bacterium]
MRSPRCAFAAFLAAAAAMAMVSAPAVVRADDPPAGDAAQPNKTVVQSPAGQKVPTVEWDFRTERDPAKVGWPTGQGDNDTFTIEGDFVFHLLLQDGKDVNQRVHQVNGQKSGNLVESVQTTTAPESTDQAYGEAKQMLQALGFDKKALGDLEAWHKKAVAGNYDNLDLKVENSYNRVFTLHLVNDGTSEHPWSLGLDVDWKRVCGCHG